MFQHGYKALKSKNIGGFGRVIMDNECIYADYLDSVNEKTGRMPKTLGFSPTRGGIFALGRNDGGEPILWRILDIEGNNITAISEYCLDVLCFHSKYRYPTWKDSDIRKWLNTIFYENSFSPDEREVINQVRNETLPIVDHDGNCYSGGDVTQDYVYLLDVKEVFRYFTSPRLRKALPSTSVPKAGTMLKSGERNINSIVDTDKTIFCNWWLRSPGSDECAGVCVAENGDICHKFFVTSPDIWVRPVIQVQRTAYQDLFLAKGPRNSTQDSPQELLHESFLSIGYKKDLPPEVHCKSILYNGVWVNFRLGDITTVMGIDAIVNSANVSLLGGGGVDGAIHRAAGVELQNECRYLHGCNTGEAKITHGYNLPCRYVIHTCGPVWRGGYSGEEELLQNCYYNSLQLAVENNIRSIAFPSISTGIYGYPINLACRTACETVMRFLDSHPGKIDTVEWVLYEESTYELYVAIISQIVARRIHQRQGNTGVAP